MVWIGGTDNCSVYNVIIVVAIESLVYQRNFGLSISAKSRKRLTSEWAFVSLLQLTT